MTSTPCDPSLKKLIAKCVIALAEQWGKKISKPGMWLYVAAMRDLTPEQVVEATTKAARQCSFMPPSAELRALAGVPDDEQLARLAYEAADRAAHREGAYKSIEFDDLAITATIRTLGGWVAFCESKPENTYYVKQWLDTYRGFLRSGTPKELTGYLPGIHELDPNNANYRHRLAAPVKVACLSASGVKRLGGAA